MSVLARHWFLILLFAALAFGFWTGQGLEWFSTSRPMRNAIVFSVMFAMALPLEFRSFVTALRKPAAMILACLMNTALLPLALATTIFYLDSSIAAGFVVVGAIPCTLASAAVWTRKAGGNDAVAMMVTVLTNSFCFLTTPFLIWLSLGSYREIDAAPMIWRLMLLVVMPIGLAQALRMFAKVQVFAANQKTKLSVYAQAGVLTMVVIGATNTRIRMADGSIEFSPLPLFQMIGISILVHGVILAIGFGLSELLKLGRGNAIAVAISGSQKTMMVGLLVCDDLKITIVPMVVYHAVQLIFDTLFASWISRRKPGETRPGEASE